MNAQAAITALKELNEQYTQGLLTDDEYLNKTIDIIVTHVNNPS